MGNLCVLRRLDTRTSYGSAMVISLELEKWQRLQISHPYRSQGCTFLAVLVCRRHLRYAESPHHIATKGS